MSMMLSPLGLPLPEGVGRQDVPSLEAIAEEAGTSRGRSDVEHLCPDCGDPAAGRIIVELCRTCGGTGRVSDTRMVVLFGPAGERVRPV